MANTISRRPNPVELPLVMAPLRVIDIGLSTECILADRVFATAAGINTM